MVAKESSVLSAISGGRFEMAVGAGDWPQSYVAWGQPFPDRAERIACLAETVDLMRRLWTGEAVTHAGQFHALTGRRLLARSRDSAARHHRCRPVGQPGRVRRRLRGRAQHLRRRRFLERVQALIAASSRAVDISVFVGWECDKWPADPVAELSRWNDPDMNRAFVSLGGSDMLPRLEQTAPLAG